MDTDESAARYHMRRADRAIEDAAAIDTILAEGRFATIALAREGEPYLVTLSYGFDPVRRAMYFHAAHEGLKHEFMRANPSVCATVVVDGGYRTGECAHEYRSVVIRGTMTEVGDMEESRHGMHVLLGQLESEADGDRLWDLHALGKDTVWGRLAVLRLDILEISGKQGS